MNRPPTCRWSGATQTSSAFSMLYMCAFQSSRIFNVFAVRTFEFPADLDHVWEWHTGGKIETDEFDNQPLDG
jgi:hypothetical protein